MKVAVTGKGGVGKTTFASTLCRLYAAEGRNVLAADVDPDANLGLALGLTEEGVGYPIPKLVRVNHFYENIAGQKLALDNFALAVLLFDGLFHWNFNIENHAL